VNGSGEFSHKERNLMSAQARVRFIALLNMMHKIRPPRSFVFTGTSGWPVNETSETGLTPLFMAVRWRQPDVVEYLLQLGADVSHPLPGWPSVLEVASCLKDDEILQMLRNAGALPKTGAQLQEERSQRGPLPLSIWFPSEALPLYHAAMNGDFDAAIAVIRKLAGDEVFTERLLSDYFPSFPVQHLILPGVRANLAPFLKGLLSAFDIDLSVNADPLQSQVGLWRRASKVNRSWPSHWRAHWANWRRRPSTFRGITRTRWRRPRKWGA
jgi:hypothetical protein